MTMLKSREQSLSNGTPTHYKARHCLLCRSSNLRLALPLAHSAIGNDYLPSIQPQQEFAQNLHLCTDCGNVQIEDVVNPDILFRSYTYATKSSLGLVKHFQVYAGEVASRAGAAAGSLVIDIGSNDGSLLRAFQELGFRGLGIDPAVEIARQATADGVETLPEYFTLPLARRIRESHGQAAIITANNVFAHSDKLPDMADGIRELLQPDGLFTFEVSYLLDIVHKMLFDTVYHEHLCYHSVKSLEAFFSRHGLELIDVQRVPTKAGSLRGTVQKLGGPRKAEPVVQQMIEWEAIARLHESDTWHDYTRRIAEARDRFNDLIDRTRAAGKRVAGYGASPTVTTLINQFGLAGKLDFLVDDNAVKQNTFSPGHHIPVYPSDELYSRNVDAVALLAWNYAAPIAARHTAFTARGGRFLVPLPYLQIL
jgi:hypothetical protein